MLLIKNVNLKLDSDFSDPAALLASSLKINKSTVKSAELYKKSVDARHKNNIVFCCSFLAEFTDEKFILRRFKNAEIYNKKPYLWKTAKPSDKRPIVVGFGPAGIFAALVLAKAGLKPIIFERGERIEDRIKSVDTFLGGGKLNPNSNVQFGEGGAGTFSDGKLNTGTKDERIRVILETFYEFGADKKILYEAKPHIGTDILRTVIKNIRNEIISLGGEVHFGARMDNIIVKGGKVYAIEVTECGKTGKIECDKLILCIGHSARDTFKMLKNNGVTMEKKAFSVGARIEHLQESINKSLYGDSWNSPYLSAADYKMAVHLGGGRGVYTFCMCPGGEVINASSEEGMIAVNGMSYMARNGKNANSALLVDVRPDDLEGDDILSGVEFQRKIESTAYNIKNGAVPYCTVGDLLGIKTDKNSVSPTVKPNTVRTDITSVLPDFVCESLKEALPLFERKISGFSSPDAILTFPETRSSSPVRILRKENYNSVNIKGLYPTGEGAGYAGGIMSAAVDGMRVAEAVVRQDSNRLYLINTLNTEKGFL